AARDAIAAVIGHDQVVAAIGQASGQVVAWAGRVHAAAALHQEIGALRAQLPADVADAIGLEHDIDVGGAAHADAGAVAVDLAEHEARAGIAGVSDLAEEVGAVVRAIGDA